MDAGARLMRIRVEFVSPLGTIYFPQVQMTLGFTDQKGKCFTVEDH